MDLIHLHLHGLFRGKDLELGRDADTGGQTTYVLELVRALARQPGVDRVDVVTRLIEDRRISSGYARAEEVIAPGARILRFPFGPRRYLRKELIWPHLDELADRLAGHIERSARRPHWIHAHYADAGYVGALVSRRLDIPLVFTGHSLGREKLRRLLTAGQSREAIDQHYAISRRIDSEELALAQSSLVVTSTQQEITRQYARYGRFHPEQAEVIPPGVDLQRFHPPEPGDTFPALTKIFGSFLRNPALPPIVALSRADRRKNAPALLEAFGRSARLRSRHNLILVMGCRDDIRNTDREQREIFHQVFELIDRYDLYGQVAYPKAIDGQLVPSVYRWAAQLGGLFVNPALTEPFGLTLLEAAASGLPLVATDDGGPCDIIARCGNGLLTDVTDLDQLRAAIERVLADRSRWQAYASHGLEAVREHFSWQAHARRYLALASAVARQHTPLPIPVLPQVATLPHLASSDRRLLICDLDVALREADAESLTALCRRIEQSRRHTAFGLSTGCGLLQARDRLEDLGLPQPDILITRSGTEIHYGENAVVDEVWRHNISQRWDRQTVAAALDDFGDRLSAQDQEHQGPFKISYLVDCADDAFYAAVQHRLRELDLPARPQLFDGRFLDVLPLNASKADAIRHLSRRWAIPLENILVVVSQQGDGDMLRGLPLGVVLVDHDPALDRLRQHRSVFFARRPRAWGILEAMDHYRFAQR
ncbi:MAG: glycosyltransferase [Aphanocapsa feldmannii 288cV]|nr:MAG: glycosyltransferase [Aphanocapsa feldmannii 288cV]